jgi:hypothetical protein
MWCACLCGNTFSCIHPVLPMCGPPTRKSRRPTNPEEPVVEFGCLLERLAADAFEGRVEGPRAMLGSSECSARRLALESL